MYQVTIGTNMPSVNDYKYGVEQLFIDLLQDSHYSVLAKVSIAILLMYVLLGSKEDCCFWILYLKCYGIYYLSSKIEIDEVTV